MDKRRRRLDSASLKGPETSFHRILIIVSRGIIGGKEECERNFQISEIGNIFVYNVGIKRVMNKRRPRLDSACLKGSKIPLYRILIIVGSCVSGGGKGLDYVFYGRHSSNTQSSGVL